MASKQQAQSDKPWYLYPITQGFKWTPSNTVGHSGVDIGCPLGTPVTAPVTGQIVGASCHAWGIQVDIKFTSASGETLVVSFLHLMQLAPGIAAGQVVQVGTVLGYTGGVSSGVPCPTARKYSTGAHLHLELTHGSIPPYTTYNPRSPDTSSYPMNPLAFLTSIKSSMGTGDATATVTPLDFATQDANQGLGANGVDPADQDPGSGQTAAALVVEVPGFFGLCLGMDVAEALLPYNPPTGLSGALEVPGYTVKWFVRNVAAIFIRLTLMTIGVFLLIALLAALIHVNEWLQQAGSLVIPLAVGAM